MRFKRRQRLNPYPPFIFHRSEFNQRGIINDRMFNTRSAWNRLLSHRGALFHTDFERRDEIKGHRSFVNYNPIKIGGISSVTSKPGIENGFENICFELSYIWSILVLVTVLYRFLQNRYDIPISIYPYQYDCTIIIFTSRLSINYDSIVRNIVVYRFHCNLVTLYKYFK